jgi:hypothetical protein
LEVVVRRTSQRLLRARPGFAPCQRARQLEAGLWCSGEMGVPALTACAPRICLGLECAAEEAAPADDAAVAEPWEWEDAEHGDPRVCAALTMA